MHMSPLQKYFFSRVWWYLGTLLVAICLNFILPRLGPSNPVDTIMAHIKTPGLDPKIAHKMEERLRIRFNIDKPLHVQLGMYVYHTIKGFVTLDMDEAFGDSYMHNKPVWAYIGPALPWTLGLQIPTLVIGYILGNILGALAAYKRGIFDKLFYPMSLFFTSVPYFCVAIFLVYIFGISLEWFPAMNAYGESLSPSWSITYVSDVLYHYTLPFMAMFLVYVGGQAIGMRSMSIYELGTDYVKYAKMLGSSEGQIVRYVFRNAMLPQLTGLALALGMMVGGALLIEIVFSYPGVGSLFYTSIKENDYPVLQAGALIVTICVLIANFIVDILIGILDPRIRVAQEGENA